MNKKIAEAKMFPSFATSLAKRLKDRVSAEYMLYVYKLCGVVAFVPLEKEPNRPAQFIPLGKAFHISPDLH